MPVAGRDNRQYKRRSLYYYLKVLDQDTGQEIGRLVDIHVAGLLLISEKQLESGQTFNIRIPPDESVRSLSCNLDLKAVVRWSNQDINPDYYVSGLQFLEITPVQEDLIEEIVRVIGFKI
ncbi:MAG: PilZ domain-containing protein [Desulfonatronovibrio sp.]